MYHSWDRATKAAKDSKERRESHAVRRPRIWFRASWAGPQFLSKRSDAGDVWGWRWHPVKNDERGKRVKPVLGSREKSFWEVYREL